MSPHCRAIFLQHSRSAAVIAASGTTHAITGNAANNTARAKAQTLINSFNILSLLMPDMRRNRRGKVSAYYRHAIRQPKPCIAGISLFVRTMRDRN